MNESDILRGVDKNEGEQRETHSSSSTVHGRWCFYSYFSLSGQTPRPDTIGYSHCRDSLSQTSSQTNNYIFHTVDLLVANKPKRR